MKLGISIPTYNEVTNIPKLLLSIKSELSSIKGLDTIVVIVDDNSPDGTAELVRAERTTFSNLHLITGEKQGLGAAYVRGMKFAIDELHAEVVMEMDADFSHDPTDVPRLIEAVTGGADFVIGSRYVAGGKIPEDWSFLRRMNSRWGNVFARYIAGMYQVRDCTAGFRAIRSSTVSKIDLDALKVRGYAFQISLLHEAIMNHAKVREIPVEFVDRKRGQTKLGLSDIMEFMLNAWWIRFERSKTFLRFSIVGASGVAVNLVSFTKFMHLGLSKFIASPLAIELSIITNFLLNNFWTFSHRDNDDKIHIRGLKFNIVSFASLGVSYATFLLFDRIDPDGIPQIHQAAGIVPATLINYFLNSYWTFKE